MCSIVKSVIRLGVIGGLVTGAAVVVAGPDRVFAAVHQVRHRIVMVIDNNIDDPVAMRAQLRSLEAQYPQRIAEVRTHLTNVSQEMAQLQRDKAVSERVVELARADLGEMQELLARADEARGDGYSIVKVNFENQVMSMDTAYHRASDISETVDIYETRVADYSQDMANLEADEAQLSGLLGKLEREHSEFQTQLAHLERQIDAVARKERMVDVMAERQKKLDELSRYEVASIDQFKAKLAQRTAELDAELATLVQREGETSYEDVAKLQINKERSTRSRIEKQLAPKATPEPTETTIQLGPDGDAEQVAETLVSRGQMVIR